MNLFRTITGDDWKRSLRAARIRRAGAKERQKEYKEKYMKTEIINVRITSTMLGLEDHGIFTAFIYFEGDGTGGGFGGHCFDQYDQAKKKRVGHAFGIEYISSVLKVVGVEKWEDLPGEHIRVISSGLGSRTEGIGHIYKDLWFRPQELLEEMLEDGGKK
jgi:hypothetical protein